MINVRKSFFSLFGLYLIFSNTECCFDDGKLGSFMFFLIILKFSQYVILMCAQSQVKKFRKVDSVHCLNRTNILGPWMCNFTSFCHTPGCYLPKPNITLKAINDKQTLVVSWLVKHSSFVGDIYEIELSRTEQHTVIYTVSIERCVFCF